MSWAQRSCCCPVSFASPCVSLLLFKFYSLSPVCFFCVIPLAGTKLLCLFHPWVGGVSALREEVTIDNSKNNYALGTRSEISKQSERVVQSEITRQKHNYVWDAEQRKWVPLKPDNSSQPYAGHMCDYKTTSNRLVLRYKLPFASCSISYN